MHIILTLSGLWGLISDHAHWLQLTRWSSRTWPEAQAIFQEQCLVLEQDQCPPGWPRPVGREHTPSNVYIHVLLLVCPTVLVKPPHLLAHTTLHCWSTIHSTYPHCWPTYLGVILLTGIGRELERGVGLLSPQLVVRGQGEVLGGGQPVHLVPLYLGHLCRNLVVVAVQGEG